MDRSRFHLSLFVALAVTCQWSVISEAQMRGAPGMSARMGAGLGPRMSAPSSRNPMSSMSRSSAYSRGATISRAPSISRSSIRAGAYPFPYSSRSFGSSRIPYPTPSVRSRSIQRAADIQRAAMQPSGYRSSSFYRSPVSPYRYSSPYQSLYRSPSGITIYSGRGAGVVYSRYGVPLNSPYSYYQPYFGTNYNYGLSSYYSSPSVSLYVGPRYSASAYYATQDIDRARVNPYSAPSSATGNPYVTSSPQRQSAVRNDVISRREVTRRPSSGNVITGDLSDPSTKLVPGMILPDGSRVISVGGTTTPDGGAAPIASQLDGSSVVPAQYEQSADGYEGSTPTAGASEAESGPSILQRDPEEPAAANRNELPQPEELELPAPEPIADTTNL